MMTNGVICLSNRERAREIAKTRGRGYLYSLVCLYHDTMPKPDYAPVWPAPPLDPPATDEELDELIAAGWLLCGTPDEVAEQVDKYQTVGCDQVVFGLPNDGMPHDEVLEMIELFGTKVIPHYDTDPVHSTTHYRKTATRRYPDFTEPVPDLSVELLPSNAQLR
jgi:alkanesulfonate monooxygenase SsuD/methylene tetrahydromethanopterin reductase-like flavin-dependent oxidoreductase (luciferase family)